MSVLWAQSALADQISLAWDPNTQVVSGYAVYVGTTSGVYPQRYDVGPATSFTYPSANAGQMYCFAVAAYTSTAESAKSAEVCGYSNRYPTLANPGTRSSTVGQATSLQLNGVDPDGQPITYSATGLPPGLSLMASTGYIAGTGTAAGTFSVTARAFDGVLTTSQTFNWTMTAATSTPPPDTGLPSINITAPTVNSSYSSTVSSVGLSGTAADSVGVTQVNWANDRGGSGVATGTTSWGVGSIVLQVGTNVITVTARDAAGNIGTDVLTITYSSSSTGPDTTPPSVSITAPTSASSYTTSLATIGLSGNAVDNVAVTAGTWENNRGGRGMIAGTSNWSASVPLVGGTNVVTITVRDAAGNIASDTLTVTYSTTTTPPPPSPDTIVPSVSISGPTSATTYTTSSSAVLLSGTSSDNVGVTLVTWANSRGGSGTASGTTSWNGGSVPLQGGSNVITVTARDAAGNVGTDVLTITYNTPAPAPAPTVVLSGQFDMWLRNGKRVVNLSWTTAPWSTVYVFRNGNRIDATTNTGAYRDTVRTPGTYTYKICAPNSTTNCSNTVTLYW